MWKLAVLLYVPSAAAVAINLFMIGLIGPAIGLPHIPPWTAVWISAFLGVPAAWWAGRRLRALMDQADREVGAPHIRPGDQPR